MKIKEIINEAPISIEQEREQLRPQVQHHVDTHGKFPSVEKIHELMKKIDPDVSFLGRGGFGTVYSKPDSNSVIKVAEYDRYALLYLKWCIENQDNPHVPKIYALYYPNTLKDGNMHTSFYVIMEKLTPVVSSRYKWSANDLPWFYHVMLHRFNRLDENLDVEFFQMLRDAGVSEENIETISMTQPDRNTIAWWPLVAKKLKELEPQLVANIEKKMDQDRLVEILRFVELMPRKVDYAVWKIAPFSNIMQRPSTGELVVTDPLADI